ncbi:hypothetical protein H2203_006337 [Taxawa tesnikishii (nom. ined.)]|nr:hypothetical protein H2203_006337 [Dothideales sp. JES 119]
MSRETLPIPEREEGDTPGKYLERLEAAASRSLIAGLMSKSSDPFHQAVLRSYTRRFPFFGEPIDMSLRKFLLEAELPKETQQVDRVIQAFADRYHECNPGIFVAPDQAYVIAFSLMMLHTDAFNKNNKHKMQKSDYIKNTSGQHVSEDVLACFYDNICYTPFIHFEEDVDFNGEKVQHTFKSKTTKLKGAITDPVKKPSGPVDPYALICDSKLDLLRPSIKDSISMDDPYSYLGTAKSLDVSKLLQAFVNTGVLQIISARSRPAAFESEASRENPDEAKPGVVDLNITKVGILWRKSTKRKKARSPWQEWGGILTGSQLYLFKNAPWVKNLMHQQHVHLKQGHGSSPVVFKPPLTEFKPDALIKTDDAVALHDSSYIRHKHAFTLVRHGGQEEVFLAESEAEMNDWLALINYAAAFRSAGVRIRGFIAGNEGAGNHGMIRSLRKLESSHSAHSLGPSQLENQRQISHQLATQVMAARRQIILQRISEAEKQIAEAKKRLDDLLRDARHLQVLAPIQPRTREGVIHAAARMDAMLKWVRREIWRTKCHKDILALDVQEDGPTNADATENADSNVAVPPTPESIFQGQYQRAQESTVSDTAYQARHKVVFGDFFANDAFKTPRNTLSKILGISLPCTSTLHSRKRGLLRNTVLHFRDREAVKLAMDGLEPTYTAASSIGPHASHDFPIEKATPESTSKRQSVRRSLHRSLREGVGHTPSSAHRHRKGKESASTVRSDASRAEDLPEGTPGLERSGKKFIVHGKQASVITFGGDWAEEKMRLRREVALQRLHGAASESESGPDANLRAHVARELGEDFTDGYSVTSDDTTTARSASLSRDTELADAYVTAPATRRGSEGAGRTSPTLPISDDEALDSYFDVNAPHAAGKPRPEDRRRTLMRAPKSKEAVTAPEAEAEQSDGASASHDDDVFGDAERPGSRLTFTLGPVTPNEDEKGEGKGKG